MVYSNFSDIATSVQNGNNDTQYIIIGKMCIGVIRTIITADKSINLGIPIPMNNYVVPLRSADNGEMSLFWIRSDNGYLTSYKASNFTNGNKYEGMFAYFIK